VGGYDSTNDKKVVNCVFVRFFIGHIQLLINIWRAGYWKHRSRNRTSNAKYEAVLLEAGMTFECRENNHFHHGYE
jgi:hypothetical protein